MVTYVSKFIPNLSQANSVLRDLTKKIDVWNWDTNVNKAFNKLKELLIKNPVFKYYDVKKLITLCVDASRKGLGAVLLQENLCK